MDIGSEIGNPFHNSYLYLFVILLITGKFQGASKKGKDRKRKHCDESDSVSKDEEASTSTKRKRGRPSIAQTMEVPSMCKNI